MNPDTLTVHLKTIADFHAATGLSKPKHPLFGIYRIEDLPAVEVTQRTRIISDFYQIALKKECPCKMQYGQTPFDFDEGIISCFAPRQVSIVDKDFTPAKSGWLIQIHPDFLRTYSLNQKIKTFGFFDYRVNEALILSEEEQKSIEIIFEQIEKEYLLPIDQFSQDVMISALDLLLTHCNRYYTRQFITRKPQSSELLTKVEIILNAYFCTSEEKKTTYSGLFGNRVEFVVQILKRLSETAYWSNLPANYPQQTHRKGEGYFDHNRTFSQRNSVSTGI